MGLFMVGLLSGIGWQNLGDGVRLSDGVHVALFPPYEGQPRSVVGNVESTCSTSRRSLP